MKITSLEIRIGFVQRSQRRSRAKIGHLSHSLGMSVHLQTERGDNYNKMYDCQRYPRRGKLEVRGSAIELKSPTSDVTIYESLHSITPSAKEDYWKMQ